MGILTVATNTTACPESVILIRRSSSAYSFPNNSNKAQERPSANSKNAKSRRQQPQSQRGLSPVPHVLNRTNLTASTTRKSLLFVVLAGGVAFLQLAYHVNYLIERYSLEYSITTTIASEPIISSGGGGGGGGTSGTNHLLEIKLTTTTTTAATTDASDTAITSRNSYNDNNQFYENSPNAQARTRTMTVTTRQLNLATTTVAAETTGTSHDRTANTNLRRRPRRRVVPSPSETKVSEEEDIILLTAPPRFEVLIVVPGLGDMKRIPNVEQSLRTIYDSLYKAGYGFGCQVFVWNVEILLEAQDRLSPLNCEVHLSQGMWTHHMSRVPSILETNYTHVGVLMDDVDVSGVEMADFLHLMDWSGFGVASPAFHDPIYRSMHVRYNCFFHRTDFVNIFFAVFASDVWNCWQTSMIDTVNNPLGWGMDVTLHRLCNTSLGVIDAHTGVHKEARSSYSQNEARRQMYKFITSRVGTSDAKRYLECAGQTRPAAFEECQVYWDGTEATSKTVDWSC